MSMLRPDWPAFVPPPTRRDGPLFEPTGFRDTKDPCPVWDGHRWHLFGSGGSSTTERWSILHAVADGIGGPWREHPPSRLHGVTGEHIAAPGVAHDGAWFHMFVQTDHRALGGSIEHLVSDDGGLSFHQIDTPIRAEATRGEACVYDPHPAELGDDRYLVYSACAEVGRPDLFLARSTTGSWNGRWERLGMVLSHHDVAHHNQLDDPDYEWGLEGAQLVPLPSGRILLNAVCFLPGQPYGTRQRVFFAVANEPAGPYRTLGPVLWPQPATWESGENGHAAAVVDGDRLVLFYQARPAGPHSRWRYGFAEWPLDELDAATR